MAQCSVRDNLRTQHYLKEVIRKVTVRIYDNTAKLKRNEAFDMLVVHNKVQKISPESVISRSLFQLSYRCEVVHRYGLIGNKDLF